MNKLQSDNISDLIKDLVLAQGKIHHARFDSSNPHFKSDYASLESVIDAIKKPLLEHGLVVIQQPILENDAYDAMSVLVTTLAHSSGQWIRSYTGVINEKKNCQSMGSGLSYARRYALAAMLNIGQSDDDGNEATAKPMATPEVSTPASRPTSVRGPISELEIDQLKRYVINFGKQFNGVQLGDMSSTDVQKYINDLEAYAAKNKTTLEGQALVFKTKGLRYIELLRAEARKGEK